MKTANTNEGKKIVASPSAPTQAICPVCGGLLTLRSRRTMGNGNNKTYFWRHGSNRNRYCTARHRPVN